MITEFQKAMYQVLTAATSPGQPLENVPEILESNMEELKSGGITVGSGDESYLGGSENRRDIILAELDVYCVVKKTRGKKHREALIEADQMAKAVRQAVKGNLRLTCTAYPNGFATENTKILRTNAGYGQHAGGWHAVATVTIEAKYTEVFS